MRKEEKQEPNLNTADHPKHLRQRQEKTHSRGSRSRTQTRPNIPPKALNPKEAKQTVKTLAMTAGGTESSRGTSRSRQEKQAAHTPRQKQRC